MGAIVINIFLLLLVSSHTRLTRAVESCSVNSTDAVSVHITIVEEAVRTSACELMSPARCPEEYTPDDGESFDFVVVGGGTTGSLLANRLSEVANSSVLVLETGGCPSRTNEVPAFFTSCTESDWSFYTAAHDDNCLGMEGGRCRWPQGRVLGGDSSINFGTYMRGHRKDYDRWKDAGCAGWGYDDVLEHFVAHEDMRASEVLATSDFAEYHNNVSGGLPVETWNTSRYRELIEAFEESAVELGLSVNRDVNGNSYSGYTVHQGMTEGGRRCSAEKVFLQPCYERDNAFVVTGATVRRVLFEDGEAVGVLYSKDGVVRRVLADKEVIVAAGAVNTPKLLMLSGLGPRTHLESLGIDCVKDLPVGENLQDHPFCLVAAFTHNSTSTKHDIDQQIYNFLMRKEDCELSNHGIATNSFLWNSRKWTDDHPDLQMMTFNFHERDDKLPELLRYLNYNRSLIERLAAYNQDHPTILLFASLLQPFSKGRVELASNDSLRSPRIFPGYFSDKRDVHAIANAFRFADTLAETAAMRRIGVVRRDPDPGWCWGRPRGSRAHAECWARHVATAGVDQTQGGTSRMGPEDCGDAVCDPRLRVRGVRRLRVAGAAVFPTTVCGTNAATELMVAERCADFIKQDHGQQP